MADDQAKRGQAAVPAPPALDLAEEYWAIERTCTARMVVVSSFVFHFFVVGFCNSFGVFQEEYSTEFPHASKQSITWINSAFWLCVLTSAAIFGRTARRLGFVFQIRIAALVMSGTLVAAGALGSELWHLYIFQGVVMGLGVALVFVPAVSAVGMHYLEHRGLAVGMASAGTGVGGFFWSPLLRFLLENTGRGTTLIIAGTTMGVITLAVAPFLRERPPPPRSNLSSSGVDVAARRVQRRPSLSDLENLAEEKAAETSPFAGCLWWAFCLGMALIVFGYLNPFVFFVTYAVDHGHSKSLGAFVTGLALFGSAVGRIACGKLADWMSPLAATSASALFSALVCGWLLVDRTVSAGSEGWTLACTVIMVGYGISSASVFALMMPNVASMYGAQNAAALMGALMATVAPAAVFGPPVYAYLLDGNDHSRGILFTLCVLASGGLLLWAVRKRHDPLAGWSVVVQEDQKDSVALKRCQKLKPSSEI